jgi:hypothetical protein
MATKEVKSGPNMNFAFGKKNYMYLIVGIVLLIIGFISLSGGGSKDPNQFSEELFSSRRMVFAPIVLMLGYIVVAIAILTKPTEEQDGQTEGEQE